MLGSETWSLLSHVGNCLVCSLMGKAARELQERVLRDVREKMGEKTKK